MRINATNGNEEELGKDDFDRRVAESQRRADELKTKIQARNKNFNVRQSDAFVFEMHATMSFLISDLLVGVLYQDPDKMSALLPHIQGRTLAREAEYRSLSKDFSSDYPNPRGYSPMRFYAPIRKELWNWIRSDNATREEQLQRLDTVFLRMRVLMGDILKAYHKVNPKFSNHPVAQEGKTHSYLKAIGFDREKLNNRLALISCKTALSGDTY